MAEPKVMRPGRMNNVWLHWSGFLFMILNKIRHKLRGYKTPRPFSPDSIQQSVDYALLVCREWEEMLADYLGNEDPFKNQDIIEIGPGPDVGNGLVLIAKGAKTYTAVDKHNLIKQTDSVFYERLLDVLKEEPGYQHAREAYELFSEGRGAVLTYVHDPSFRLDSVRDQEYDLLVSRAAMEHFEDLPGFFRRIRSKMREGGAMISLIDFKTHTRYIRDVDPLNILRYSDRLYRWLGFTGIPNRLRMSDCMKLLEEFSFQDIRSEDYEIVTEDYVNAVRPGLAPKYRNYPDLKTVVAWLMARCR